jgi:hypothetical protein
MIVDGIIGGFIFSINNPGGRCAVVKQNLVIRTQDN